jgi:hypothetical protein
MARERKDKDEAAKSSETSNHIFHNTGRETAKQGFNNHYSLTNKRRFPSPHLFTRIQPASVHLAPATISNIPAFHSAPRAISGRILASSESALEYQVVNNIVPSQGHIFAITGGSNQEHGNKRARKEFERRVHTVSPRVPLNSPAWSMVPITFDENDFQVRDFPHTNAFVATTNIAGFTVHNILIDNKSSADILLMKPFEQMNLDRRTLELAGNSLFGFGGRKIDALGKKAIPISFAEGEKVRTETITFDIVIMDYPCTAIFGRGVLSGFKIVIKQSYLCMKMPSPFGIIAVHGDQAASR